METTNGLQSEEIRLETRQGCLAGLAWRQPGAPRVLALHGWLDNAASFVPLAPWLNRLDRVALDLPGHGHSDHRPAAARYHFIDYLFDLDSALDALNWPDCHLLGHSMGAGICATYAAGAPERVRSLVLLDSIGPLAGEPERTAERLRRSLAKSRKGAGEPRRYPSIADMVAARRKVSDLSEEAARLICERSARPADGPEDGCFTWRSDPALNWVSALLMTEEQALDLLRHVAAPVLTIHVTPESPWFTRERIDSRLAAVAHGRHLTRQGHHHFHMDEPGEIAETIQSFIMENDRPPAENETDA
jgi:pimeloyl-ACP methyl ester carboxylesterase